MESIFNDKSILVTGGAGFIGRHLVKKLINDYTPKVVRAFDINEGGLQDLNRDLEMHEKFRAFLGDIRNANRVKKAMQNTDIVFHLGAYKHLSLLERNPFEAVSTNVVGTETLIDCAVDANAEFFLNVSTDKSTQFSSIYGATKFLTEQLIIDAANWKGDARTIFANARPVNVLYSDGSVLPYWHTQISQGKSICVTHPQATRFFLSIEETLNFLIKCISLMKGGEIFVPSTGVQELRIIDLAKKMSENIKIVGLSKGEKLRELLMDPSEEERAEMIDGIWVIR